MLEYRAQSRRYAAAIVYNRVRFKVKPIKTTRNQIFFTRAVHTELLLFAHDLTADNLFDYLYKMHFFPKDNRFALDV